jgi:hypothetical protein
LGYQISYLLAQTECDLAIGAFNLSEISLSAEQPVDKAPFWATHLRKTGWTLIWAEDECFFEQREARIVALSQHGPVISCVVNETVMASVASCWMGGAKIWSVGHHGDDNNNGNEAIHLDVSGTPPLLFETVRDRAAERQTEDGSVDHFFQIPLDLAAMETGFRHGAPLRDDEVDEYIYLAMTPKPSFFARLLGKG